MPETDRPAAPFIQRCLSFTGRSGRRAFWVWQGRLAIPSLLIYSFVIGDLSTHTVAFVQTAGSNGGPIDANTLIAMLLEPGGQQHLIEQLSSANGRFAQKLLTGWGMIAFIPSTSSVVRRLHDTGRSAWYLLLGLIPLAGLIAIGVLCSQAGQARTNEWGKDPGEEDQPDWPAIQLRR